MAKSKETFNKKSKEQKRQKDRQEKREKMEARKQSTSKGKSLEDMMAYVDENGNLSGTPPNPKNKISVRAEDIVISIPPGNKRDDRHFGSVHLFNEEKGFGFIIDSMSKERIFFHVSRLNEEIHVNDKVEFEIERGERGWVAVNIGKMQS